MTKIEALSGWPWQEGLSCFSSYFFLPLHFVNMTFKPFTSCQWTSTWKLRTDHITLSAVPSKT